MKVWCLFEQSGAFKNAFKELGFEAVDIDLKDDFKQTDLKMDIFAEIVKAHNGETNLFDEICKDDLVFAFFPCIKFTEKSFMNTRCENANMKKYNDLRRLYYTRRSVLEIANFYKTLTTLCEIAVRRGFKMVVENPNSQPHFLNLYFPFKPALSIADRSKYGDYFKKPTNFWFFNFAPQNNVILLPEYPKGRRLNMSGGAGCERNRDKGELVRWFESEHGIKTDLQKARSLISPVFARNFIKKFVLESEQWQR